ncbi:MAG: ATP-binding protein, partial [Candidatus Omnitrophica bacterium]|nr:ATP-binding protein [Candidatus Omnitrophota bacterium]
MALIPDHYDGSVDSMIVGRSACSLLRDLPDGVVVLGADKVRAIVDNYSRVSLTVHDNMNLFNPVLGEMMVLDLKMAVLEKKYGNEVKELQRLAGKLSHLTNGCAEASKARSAELDLPKEPSEIVQGVSGWRLRALDRINKYQIDILNMIFSDEQTKNELFNMFVLIDKLRVDGLGKPARAEVFEPIRELLAGDRRREIEAQYRANHYGEVYQRTPIHIDIKELMKRVKADAVIFAAKIGLKPCEVIVNECEESLVVLGVMLELESALVNLLHNAIESCQRNQNASSQVTVTLSHLPNSRARITMSDNGHGLPDAILQDLCVGVSQKPRDGQEHGRGVIAICGIITEHKGSISAGNICERGNTLGAEFVIELPLAEKALEAGSGTDWTTEPPQQYLRTALCTIKTGIELLQIAAVGQEQEKVLTAKIKLIAKSVANSEAILGSMHTITTIPGLNGLIPRAELEKMLAAYETETAGIAQAVTRDILIIAFQQLGQIYAGLRALAAIISDDNTALKEKKDFIINFAIPDVLKAIKALNHALGREALALPVMFESEQRYTLPIAQYQARQISSSLISKADEYIDLFSEAKDLLGDPDIGSADQNRVLNQLVEAGQRISRLMKRGARHSFINGNRFNMIVWRTLMHGDPIKSVDLKARIQTVLGLAELYLEEKDDALLQTLLLKIVLISAVLEKIKNVMEEIAKAGEMPILTDDTAMLEEIIDVDAIVPLEAKSVVPVQLVLAPLIIHLPFIGNLHISQQWVAIGIIAAGIVMLLMLAQVGSGKAIARQWLKQHGWLAWVALGLLAGVKVYNDYQANLPVIQERIARAETLKNKGYEQDKKYSFKSKAALWDALSGFSKGADGEYSGYFI